MEVTADPARVSDNFRWSFGSIQIQQLHWLNWVYRSNSRGNHRITALKCPSSPPVMKVPRFMNIFFSFPTCGVLITGSVLRLSKVEMTEVFFSVLKLVQLLANGIARLCSWNQWERRDPFLISLVPSYWQMSPIPLQNNHSRFKYVRLCHCWIQYDYFDAW